MRYPYIDDTGKSREIVSVFSGYNHKLDCAENEFFEMQNMTSMYYPILSPRHTRGFCKVLTNPQGFTDKDELVWIDDGVLYIDNEAKSFDEGITLTDGEKTLAKMGAFLAIFPDKVWYNTADGTSGKMEESFSNGTGTDTNVITFTLTDSNGAVITYHDEEYYKSHTPASGDYLMSTSNGKSVLKQWSASASVWSVITTTYVQITSTGIGKGFKPGDGLKITVDMSASEWKDGLNIFVNDDGEGKHSTTTVIKERTDDSITIVGIIAQNVEFSVVKGNQMPIVVRREVPGMSFVTECNNRLWGCSEDGREIYCCKLGDITNWYVYQGISTDSWAVTIGSDGVFTGAVTYQGYPIFFKEDSMIKISVSATGAHQTKETYCRGVQRGCGKSICILNEILYYKHSSGICCYSGSVPFSISEQFGDEKYTDAVAGCINEQYYVSMLDEEGHGNLFVYDSGKRQWAREDSTEALWFAKHDDDLFYVDKKDGVVKSVGGTLLYDSIAEKEFDWFAESGNIGYTTSDKLYISRISIKLSMEYGARMSFQLMYDGSGEWTNIFNMTGKGTRTFTVPIIPRRCDHFKWRLKGHGAVKVLAITKTLEEGSDI